MAESAAIRAIFNPQGDICAISQYYFNPFDLFYIILISLGLNDRRKAIQHTNVVGQALGFRQEHVYRASTRSTLNNSCRKPRSSIHLNRHKHGINYLTTMISDGSQPRPVRNGPQLAPVGERTLPAKCKPSTLAYCPTMDLIAVATDDEELRVFRLNGQRVFGGSFCGDPYLDDVKNGEIKKVVWRSNGEYFFISNWFLKAVLFTLAYVHFVSD